MVGSGIFMEDRVVGVGRGSWGGGQGPQGDVGTSLERTLPWQIGSLTSLARCFSINCHSCSALGPSRTFLSILSVGEGEKGGQGVTTRSLKKVYQASKLAYVSFYIENFGFTSSNT